MIDFFRAYIFYIRQFRFAKKKGAVEKMTGWIYAAAVIGGSVILLSMLRTKRFFSALLLTCVQGVAAFFAANFAGGFFGVHLPLNWGHLAVAAVGGTPAVVMLLLLNTLFYRV